MATKTPFELRFDTLNFARNHLVDEYSAKASMLNYVDGIEKYNLIKELTYPSVDSVFELAERFKCFINDQDPKPKAPEPAKLLPLEQRLAEHCGTLLTEESFKRIFPEISYAREGLELNGEKPFSIEEKRQNEFSANICHRVLGAYRTIEAATTTEKEPREGRLFTDASLEKEVEEMERLRNIIKPAIESKIIILHEHWLSGPWVEAEKE